ncbi:ABC transporter permease subunit, partial [Klebsiella pneumoniae]
MNELLNLQGFGPLLAQGAWMTIKLAFLALVLSLSLGLIAAGAKLSSHKLLRIPATLYTTLIRSVPDLVLILLIFYSLQLWLNDLTEMLGWNYFE